MEKDQYTIKDIAELAQVSRGTVDRVLHNRGKVSPEARKKVKKILEEIEYRPNHIARNLKKNKTYKLAILFPDYHKDPYWNSCYKGITKAKKEFKNLNVKIKPLCYDLAEHRHSFSALAKEVLDGNFDGVSFVPGIFEDSQQFIEACKKANVPFTTFNTPIEKVEKVSFIGQDLYQSGRVAAEILAKMEPNGGNFTVIHIDEEPEYSWHMKQKELGFYSYFDQKQGYEIETFKLYEKKASDELKTFTDYMNARPRTTGIFVTTSKAYKLVKYLQKMGKATRIVGYDLVEKNIDYLRAGTIDYLIHQNPQEQAYLSISLLVDYFLFEKNIPLKKLLPIDIVGKENVNSYLEEH